MEEIRAHEVKGVDWIHLLAQWFDFQIHCSDDNRISDSLLLACVLVDFGGSFIMHTVPSLIMRSGSKLAQISDVTLHADTRCHTKLNLSYGCCKAEIL
ncbi:uncharacterized protein LOC131229396 isoform X1 [Magnolia sinica]|uniref:uncharacterized protein LOC131229396 isoform X1 n=1 Tax=Magnolia sinica TaxID=86752 RepID=UPI00265B02C4|nr:uncharacterized protein LOC131229396 isoform X1 [Magnolia sinica]XP_058081333.1 uncharacterized protein LOC131229396 isoform X1 [Magnolia sinica]